MKSTLLMWLAWSAAFGAQAHGFEERYDLPIPLAFVIAGACACVLLTFIVAIVWMRRPEAVPTYPSSRTSNKPTESRRHSLWFWLAKGISFLLFKVLQKN